MKEISPFPQLFDIQKCKKMSKKVLDIRKSRAMIKKKQHEGEK